jgi:type II secretory ATPase GspE/PulE/Tfp pilus assembly ATPase PilB-like protein
VSQPETRMRLGDVLIQRGFLTDPQLDVALREQRRVHRPLGEILLSLGFVQQDEIAAVIAASHGVPLVAMKDLRPDLLLIAALDAGFVQESGAFPIEVKDGVLDVVMTDPGDPEKVSAVRRRFPYPLNISMITAGGLTLMLRKFLSARESPVARILYDAEESFAKGHAIYPIEDLAQAVLVDGVRRGATDIHVEPEEFLTRVRLRIDGVLQAGESLPKQATEAFISRIKILADLNIAEKRRPQDGRMRTEVDGRDVDMRVSLIPVTFGENLVLRVLDRSSGTIPLPVLGFGASICKRLKEISDAPHGIFLVTGPTGSGKTTTLYSLLAQVDALSRNVATVEDPVEYQVPLVRQSQVESGIDFGFLEGLRSLLRQDPDVILVGEIRDPETAGMAIKAAMTGHLVFSTLHTNSAIGAIPRLLDLDIPSYLLEDSMLGIVGQRLVRKVCGVCAEPYEPTAEELIFLDGAIGTPRMGAGCDHCEQTGLNGRLVLHELFLPDSEFGRLLRNGASVGEILAHAKSGGFIDMLEDGREKVRAGITTIGEVLRVASAK